MDETNALLPTGLTDETIVIADSAFHLSYTDDLVRSGYTANTRAELASFTRYHEECSKNTQTRQRHDLACFSQFLAERAGVFRSVEELYSNAWAWEGVTHGLLQDFKLWQKEQGYAIGSMNVRLATVRKYCVLASAAGVIAHDALKLIESVKGYSRKTGLNVDENRVRAGEHTRKGHKKAVPTHVSDVAVRALRRTSTKRDQSRRVHDKGLELRDALLMCLLTEHGLRCGEVAALNIESFDLERQELKVYRQKTKDTDIYPLMPHTSDAVAVYLEQQTRRSGPLFLGYGGQRIATRTINARVAVLGLEVNVHDLSPHDLRHKWTIKVFQSGNSIDVVQAYGGWSSPAMPLHYAKMSGVTHQKLKLSE